MNGFWVAAAMPGLVVIVVVLCATIRPSASESQTRVLHALAAVVVALTPWARRTR